MRWLAPALLVIVSSSCLAQERVRARPPPQPSIYGPPQLVGAPRLHLHGRCEHPSRWHDGHKVWWYLGGWEFVEGGRLYRYPPRAETK